MWWRRSWLSLNGTMGIQGKKGALSYATQLLSTSQPIRAPRSHPFNPGDPVRSLRGNNILGIREIETSNQRGYDCDAVSASGGCNRVAVRSCNAASSKCKAK